MCYIRKTKSHVKFGKDEQNKLKVKKKIVKIREEMNNTDNKYILEDFKNGSWF